MKRRVFGGGHAARLLLPLLACILPTAVLANPSPTLDAARAHGALACGVVVEQEDFTKSDTHGDLSAFSSQVCRAIAAATLGSAGRAHLVGFPDDAHGVNGLRDGKIALLVGTTPNATSAMLHHLSFSPTLFVDGQGFLVARRLHARGPVDLRDRVICFLAETPAQVGLLEWQTRARVAIKSDPYEEAGEMEAALTTGHCDAITADVSALADMRAGFHARRGDFDILASRITFDPFAAATRDDDPAFATIVSDVVTVLIEAEQDGIGRGNLAAARDGTDPAARRLLGPTPGLVGLLGLQDGWAVRALSVAGNYGEILQSGTGARSGLDLARGPNALWSGGGMIGATAIP